MQELETALKFVKVLGGPTMGDVLDQHATIINQQTTTLQQQTKEIHALQQQVDILARGQFVVTAVLGIIIVAAVVLFALQLSRLRKRMLMARPPAGSETEPTARR